MPVLTIGEYRPDISDLNIDSTSSILNVLPRGDGYGPFKSANVFSGAMAAACRGCFFARKTDGSIKIFAGTSTRLYALDNTTLTWTDVSKGGSAYSDLTSTANWQFVQFNNKVIAVQANTVPQVFDVEIDTAFADLGGSPPQSAYVTVVNRFVVLSGLLSYPKRVQWSGLNAITTWTSGTTYSDSQDLPDGGNVRGVIGSEFGIIVQDSAIRRMIFSPGSDVVFQIDRLAKDVGAISAQSLVEANGAIFFASAKGFTKITADGGITPIGFERVDRTFLEAYDSANPQLVQGVNDPAQNVVIFTYKEASFAPTRFNKALAFNYVLNRWAPLDIEGEVMVGLAKPGLTLESLDTIGAISVTGTANNGSGLVRLTVSSTTGWTTGDIKTVASVGGTTEANGTWTITVVDGTHIDLQGSTYANAWTSGGYVAGSIDSMTVSFDDFSAATLSQLAMVDEDHMLGYFTGSNLEATVTTAEQSAIAKRMFVRGLYPITDAPTLYGSVGKRESLNATPSYTTETLINTQGFCPQRASTRHARVKMRIPAGTEWTFVSGAQPDYTTEGAR